MDVTVIDTGPVFSGITAMAGESLAMEIADRVAAFAFERTMFNLDASIRHPTPYYETRVNIATSVTGLITERRVNDSGVIYGAWLEGVSSRNQATRFKGYASFRRAAQLTRAAVPGLTAGLVAGYVRKLGGTP
jgi:hypothetical protein